MLTLRILFLWFCSFPFPQAKARMQALNDEEEQMKGMEAFKQKYLSRLAKLFQVLDAFEGNPTGTLSKSDLLAGIEVPEMTRLCVLCDVLPSEILDIYDIFDPDGDGMIEAHNLANGYSRFRELLQELSDAARSENRRIVLPGDKIARLRKEYESVRSEPFRP